MALFIRMLLATVVSVALGTCCSAEVLRVAVQKTGTFAWELAVIRAHGLDKQADLSVEVIELASPEAGKIALRAGNADIVVTDWLWVSRERGLGAKLTFYPYSSALGAVMVPASSPIQTLADLKGRKLAVAGGPIDKNWLLVLAWLKRDGIEHLLPKLGAKGRTAMIGYVFDEKWAKANQDKVARFIAMTRAAKELLTTSDAEWDKIAPLTGAP